MAEIYGLEIEPPPNGWQVTGAIVIGIATDPDGMRRTFARSAGTVMLWEALGVVRNEQMAIERELAQLPRESGVPWR